MNNSLQWILYEFLKTYTENKLTLITNALMKTAGTRSLYVFATKQPPRMVAALLANVNCHKITYTFVVTRITMATHSINLP